MPKIMFFFKKMQFFYLKYLVYKEKVVTLQALFLNRRESFERFTRNKN